MSHHQRCQLTRPIPVLLDLAASDHPLMTVDSDDEMVPVEAHGVDLCIADKPTDGICINCYCAAEFETGVFADGMYL